MKNLVLFLLSFCLSIGLYAQSGKRSPYQKKAINVERFSQPVNTGINHTLLILGSAWETRPEIGDEIAVYDSEKNMVSSIAWRPEQEGHSGLAIWGDDIATSEKEGMTPGEDFHIVFFDKSQKAIYNLQVKTWEVGGATFSKDGLSVVSSIALESVTESELELFQNVPNPAKDHTNISFYNPEYGRIKLSILNTIGQELLRLTDSKFEAGTHSIPLNAGQLSAGSYFMSLESSKNKITKQFTVVK